MNAPQTKIGHALAEGGTPPNQDAGGGSGGGGTSTQGQGNLCADGVTYDYGDPQANCPGGAGAATGMKPWLKWTLLLIVLGGVAATGWFIWSGRDATSNTYLLATEKKRKTKKPRKGRKKK